MKKNQRARYAFWPYDLFPYVLSARAIGVKDKHGYIKIEGYGNGAAVRPLAVIAGARGKTISEALKELRAERDAQSREQSIDFCQRALAIAPFLKKSIHTSAYQKLGSASEKRAVVPD